MQLLHITARNAESDGDYGKAAASFFALGMYRLASAMYRNGRSYREGIGDLLRSIELDDRVGNERRATRTSSIVREYVQPIISDDNTRIVRGLGCEWAGDALLMIGDADARSKYRRARTLFSSLDLETQRHWGNHPEYDGAMLALKRFVGRRGIDYYDSHDVDFAGRADWKCSLCEDLLE